MKTKLHSIMASYSPPDTDTPEIELEIFFTFTPGQPERGPTYACGGTPAEPAEVEFDHCEPPGLEAWATDYLQGPGYDDAVLRACEDMQPDPDAAYEARRDERMERRNYE